MICQATPWVQRTEAMPPASAAQLRCDRACCDRAKVVASDQILIGYEAATEMRHRTIRERLWSPKKKQKTIAVQRFCQNTVQEIQIISKPTVYHTVYRYLFPHRFNISVSP